MSRREQVNEECNDIPSVWRRVRPPCRWSPPFLPGPVALWRAPRISESWPWGQVRAPREPGPPLRPVTPALHLPYDLPWPEDGIKGIQEQQRRKITALPFDILLHLLQISHSVSVLPLTRRRCVLKPSWLLLRGQFVSLAALCIAEGSRFWEHNKECQFAITHLS